ncbi:MAG TPA: helix-turn-helix domain-containing protein, partial [Sphingomicrobium sp.]|nr:helix-turn-helix domain-containing protein [Sphingomicrobium sp.]
GRNVDGGVLVDFPVTRQEIAEVSGTTMHSVSRTLSAWETAGLVVVGRQKVIVCDLEGLSRIAEGTAAIPRGS